eukprot:scaffold4722_cov60-Phaeocystis_antarctica.AAC.4
MSLNVVRFTSLLPFDATIFTNVWLSCPQISIEEKIEAPKSSVSSGITPSSNGAIESTGVIALIASTRIASAPADSIAAPTDCTDSTAPRTESTATRSSDPTHAANASAAR